MSVSPVTCPEDYVSVGHFGFEDFLSYTAIGPGVSLSRHLEAACEPGKVHVSFPSIAATRGRYPYREESKRRFHGFAQPLTTCFLDPKEPQTMATEPS